MKKQLLAICLVLLVSICYAQKKPNNGINIFYKFSHKRDTLDKNKIYKEQMQLLVGTDASLYRSYDAFIKDSISKANRKPVEPDANGVYVIQAKGKAVSRSVIYRHPKTQKMVVVERLYKDYAIDEAYPIIDWKILDDTTLIANFKCQKAIGYFKGRNYIAWFAPDFPYNTGPWKLCGLPGLILEAYDEKREVEFLFDGLAATSGNDFKIPQETINATREEFNKLKKLSTEDPAAFFAGNSLGGGAVFTPSNPEFFKTLKGPVINNPIELKP